MMNKLTLAFAFSLALGSGCMTTQAAAVTDYVTIEDQSPDEGDCRSITIADAIKFYVTLNGDVNNPSSLTITNYEILDEKKFALMMEKLDQKPVENKNFEDKIWHMTASEALSHASQIAIHSATLGCAASITFLRCLKRALYFIAEHGSNGIEMLYGISRREAKKRFPMVNWNPEWDFDNNNKGGQASPNAKLIASRQRAAIASLGKPN